MKTRSFDRTTISNANYVYSLFSISCIYTFPILTTSSLITVHVDTILPWIFLTSLALTPSTKASFTLILSSLALSTGCCSLFSTYLPNPTISCLHRHNHHDWTSWIRCKKRSRSYGAVNVSIFYLPPKAPSIKSSLQCLAVLESAHVISAWYIELIAASIVVQMQCNIHTRYPNATTTSKSTAD